MARAPPRRRAAAARRPRGGLRRVRDAARRARPHRAARPRRARSPTSTPSASARSTSLERARRRTRCCTRWSCATSCSTRRRCARRCASAACCRRASRRTRRARRRRTAGSTSPPARFAMGAGRRRLRLRQRAPAPRASTLDAFRIARRPVTNATLDALRRGRRLRAPRVVVRRGLGLEGGVRHHASPGDRGGRPGRARVPRLLVRGRRLRPRARRAPPHGGRVGDGRRPGTRTAGRRRARLGVDGVRRSPATRASARTPTASTPRSSSATATACCAAARGPRTRASPPPRSATGTSPQRRQIFAGVRLAQEARPMTTLAPPADASWSPASGPGEERTLADDVLDGLTRPFKELPPKHFYDARGAELFDRICELPEYYPTRTERAILEARAARDRRAHRRRRARRARLRHGRRRRASCSTRMADAGTLRPLRPARRDRGDGPRRAPPSSSTSTRACACTASSATSSATSTRCPPPAGPRIVAFLGGTIGNFTPGSRRRFLRRLAPPARARTTTCCSAPTSSRTRRCSRPPTTTAGRHRGVQPQRPARHATASSAPTSTPDAFEHVAFFDREREWIEMRLRALRPQRVDVRRARPATSRSPRARSCGRRSARSSRRERLEARPRRRRACCPSRRSAIRRAGSSSTLARAA